MRYTGEGRIEAENSGIELGVQGERVVHGDGDASWSINNNAMLECI